MAVNTENISLGVCDVTFDTVDLGATKGGVEVTITTETYQVKIDQYGETPVKDVIMGTVIEVKVPLVETDLTKLLKILPQGVGVGTAGSEVGVEIRSGVNIDLLDIAGVLFLHPTGTAASFTKGDFTAFKAAPKPDFSFKYETGAEKIYEVTFMCYPDTTANGKIAAFGKPIAA